MNGQMGYLHFTAKDVSVQVLQKHYKPTLDIQHEQCYTVFTAKAMHREYAKEYYDFCKNSLPQMLTSTYDHITLLA